MTSELDTTLSAIDSMLDESPRGCQHCGQPRGSSPSQDFCSEACQRAWMEQTTAAPTDTGHTPREENDQETPPSWLHHSGGEEPPRGVDVLDELRTFIGRFSVFPDEHCAPMLALWYAHTHAADRCYASPRLILDSAEPESGKTRVLEVAQYLVKAPEMTISATTAALFRLVSEGPVTILFDEVDTIFNPKNGGNYEDLRGMLNAGYKRSATIARCVGDAKNMDVQRFPVYAPAALAGIAGHMPATITTRAITVHMRKRAPDEHVDEFIEEDVEREAAPLRRNLASWVTSITDQLATARPPMPNGVTDRPAEIWKPLIALADLAGDHWPDTARAACSHFVTAMGNTGRSLGTRLLADLRDLFQHHNTDRMPTAQIVAELNQLEEAPWADLHGKGLDNRTLAKELARYGIRTRDLRMPDGKVVRGYRTDGDDGLADPWRRYLPPPESAATSATATTPQGTAVADTN